VKQSNSDNCALLISMQNQIGENAEIIQELQFTSQEIVVNNFAVANQILFNNIKSQHITFSISEQEKDLLLQMKPSFGCGRGYCPNGDANYPENFVKHFLVSKIQIDLVGYKLHTLESSQLEDKLKIKEQFICLERIKGFLAEDLQKIPPINITNIQQELQKLLKLQDGIVPKLLQNYMKIFAQVDHVNFDLEYRKQVIRLCENYKSLLNDFKNKQSNNKPYYKHDGMLISFREELQDEGLNNYGIIKANNTLNALSDIEKIIARNKTNSFGIFSKKNQMLDLMQDQVSTAKDKIINIPSKQQDYDATIDKILADLNKKLSNSNFYGSAKKPSQAASMLDKLKKIFLPMIGDEQGIKLDPLAVIQIKVKDIANQDKKLFVNHFKRLRINCYDKIKKFFDKLSSHRKSEQPVNSVKKIEFVNYYGNDANSAKRHDHRPIVFSGKKHTETEKFVNYHLSPPNMHKP
jgi:hypothetical protein